MTFYNFQISVRFLDLKSRNIKVKSGLINVEIEDIDDLTKYIHETFLASSNVILLEYKIPAISLIIHPIIDLSVIYNYDISEIESLIENQSPLLSENEIQNEISDIGKNKIEKQYNDNEEGTIFELNFEDDSDPLEPFKEMDLSGKQIEYIKKMIELGFDSDELYYEIDELFNTNKSKKAITQQLRDSYELFLQIKSK